MNDENMPLVIIGSNKERAGEKNYFYCDPERDATPIFQAAIDYAAEIMEGAKIKADGRVECKWDIDEKGKRIHKVGEEKDDG